MNHRCEMGGKVIDVYKFLSRHLNSKIHKQKMEETERERERIKKVMQNTDELSEREEGMDNIMVSSRI